jgi:branched-chain amino acid transport system substrate-binding protein
MAGRVNKKANETNRSRTARKGADDMRLVTRREFLKTSGAGLAGAALLGAAGCGGSGQGGGGGQLRIGALYPFSGSLALLGEESFRGAEIARRQRNQDGGVAGNQIDYVRADVPDPNVARTEAERLLSQERLQVVIGTYSSALAMTASEVAARRGATYFELGAVTDPFTERGYETIYRTNPPAREFAVQQIRFIEEFLAPELGKEPSEFRLAIAHEDSDYGTSVAENVQNEAKPAEISLVSVEPYDAEASDLTPVILRLKDSNPDVVIAVSYAQDAILLSRQAQQQDLGAPLFGTGGGHSLQSFIEGVGEAGEGVFNVDFTQYKINTEFTPGLQRFVESYRQAYDEDPRSGHSLGNFTGANVLFDILEKTEGSLVAEDIGRAVDEYEVKQGTTATGWGVKFNENGQNTLAQPYVAQWRDGELVTVFPKDAAVAEPMLRTYGG